MIKIHSSDHKLLAETINRGLINISRVSKLVEDYKSTENEDILRLGMVFLHSTLEDCLRNLIYYKVVCMKDNINIIIPLKDSNGRKEKFTLEDITKFNEYKVEDLIHESTLDYINRLTFNNTNDLIFWFDKFGLNKTVVIENLLELEELLSRRHVIVHNSDMLTDRVYLNSKSEVIHDGTPKDLNEINSTFLIQKINLISKFLFQATIAFLPKGTKITMQNV